MTREMPTRFTAKELNTVDDVADPYYGRKPDKTPADMEALGAYLSAFPFKWKVRVVHDEPVPHTTGFGMGGTPQMRVSGILEGEGVKFGTFEVAFHGRRIEVLLSPERQALFQEAMAQLPDLREESK